MQSQIEVTVVNHNVLHCNSEVTASHCSSMLRKQALLCKCWRKVSGLLRLVENHVLVLGLFYINPDKPADKSSVKLKQLSGLRRSLVS